MLSSGAHGQIELPEPFLDAPSSYNGPSGFCWLIRGRMAGVPRPGLMSPMEEDLNALRRMGVNLLVTLTEEWNPPHDTLSEHGIQSYYVPIPDMGPPTCEQADETCAYVEHALEKGRTVAFQCHGGRGRTGTLLALQLIWYGMSAAAAFENVRSTNKNWIESDSQEEFLRIYESHHGKKAAS